MAPLRELRELREHERESPEKSCIKLEENYDFKISKSRYKVLIEESNKVRRNQMLVYQQIEENKGTYVAFIPGPLWVHDRSYRPSHGRGR